VRDRAQWLKLNKYIRYLNEHADAKTQFKVLYLGRHGQGYHNVAEAKYGTAAWDVSQTSPMLVLSKIGADMNSATGPSSMEQMVSSGRMHD